MAACDICTTWEITANLKGSQVGSFSPHQRRVAEIRNPGLFTPPGTRVAMDTITPAGHSVCPKLALLFSPESCKRRRVFLPTFPKLVLQEQKASEDLELGELLPRHLLNY